MSDTLSIAQAAGVLQVTQKTIRNYIEKGFLNPVKWNGMWQIPKRELREIVEKKNVNIKHSILDFQNDEIGVNKDEYSEQMISLGKLQAFETLIADYKSELTKANERIVQLESSGAAGWTEARTAKALCETLQSEARQSVEDKLALEKELAWIRREKDRFGALLEEEKDRNELLLGRIKELEDRLHLKALGGV